MYETVLQVVLVMLLTVSCISLGIAVRQLVLMRKDLRTSFPKRPAPPAAATEGRAAPGRDAGG